MKTVCILGSPRRNGNSDALALRFIEQASRYNQSIETVALSDISFNGCINLFECKRGSLHCGQKDGLTPVLASIATAQVLVLASPVYFTNISGQLKLAIDRLFSFFVPDYPLVADKSRLSGNRHLVFVQTQGEPEDRYRDILDNYSMGFKSLGYKHQHLVRAWGVREPGEALARPEFLQACDAAVKSVYETGESDHRGIDSDE